MLISVLNMTQNNLNVDACRVFVFPVTLCLTNVLYAIAKALNNVDFHVDPCSVLITKHPFLLRGLLVC